MNFCMGGNIGSFPDHIVGGCDEPSAFDDTSTKGCLTETSALRGLANRKTHHGWVRLERDFLIYDGAFSISPQAIRPPAFPVG